MTSRRGQERSPWLQKSKFANANKRSKSVKILLAELLDERADKSKRTSPKLSLSAKEILDTLCAPLRQEPPLASQGAEAALALAAFSIAEDRVLNLADPQAGDLENSRIAGDRGASDHLCQKLLAPRNIPCTKGPLQSSSFRGGYLVSHVREEGIRKYAAWQSEDGCTLNEITEVAKALADEFLDKSSAMPAMPELAASRFTFIAYRQARERLLQHGSKGALEQYLLARLLEQEILMNQSAYRVTTKSVGANDRASGAGGDIEVRHAQKLVASIEVSAANWSDKLAQLTTAASANLSEATIAASEVSARVSSDDLANNLGPTAERLGLDVSVLDLHALMDVAASRLTKHGRASAFRAVYDDLARWHRREPELAQRLIDTLTSLNLVAQD